MSELDKLRDELNFLTLHLPGASELKENWSIPMIRSTVARPATNIETDSFICETWSS